MRILLFGANGQVGREFCDLDTDHEVIAVKRSDADLSIPGAASNLIAREKPDYVINAAAYTNVDGAETDADIAQRINADAVGEIASAANKVGAGFLHISTDYVFDGAAETPINEETEPGPLSVYGASKLAGEKLALLEHSGAVIIRTSWVYSAHGKNFVKTMLRLAQERDELTIVSDQIGGPTPASAIAETTFKIINSHSVSASRIYHYQGNPAVSWADFATAIFEAAGASTKVVKIPTSAYKTPANRPLYTVLDCSRILRDFNIEQPDWRKDIKALVAKLLANKSDGSKSAETP